MVKNDLTQNNFELDIYIPSIKVAIEFDGSVPSHFNFNSTNTLKYNKILSSRNISKLYVIRDNDDRIVVFNSYKHINFRLNYAQPSMRLESVIVAINYILKDLGIESTVKFDYNIVKYLYKKEDFQCLLKMKQTREE